LAFSVTCDCQKHYVPRCGDVIGDDDGIFRRFPGLPRQLSAPQRAAGFADLGAVYHSAVNLCRLG
jgi:hypothetical protein